MSVVGWTMNKTVYTYYVLQTAVSEIYVICIDIICSEPSHNLAFR